MSESRLAERLAVRGSGVLAVWRAVADMTVENDQGRAAGGVPEDLQRILDTVDVVGVTDAQDVPGVALEANRDVLREGDARAAFDGDVVVVVDPAQVVEAEMAGEQSSLDRRPPSATIAAHRVDAVVEKVEAGLVVTLREPLLGHRHADAGGDPLSERARRGLHAGDPVILGVPRSLAAELTEAADVLQRHRRLSELFVLGVDGLDAGEMEH